MGAVSGVCMPDEPCRSNGSRGCGPACVGRGKVHWAEDLVARKQLDLAQSWFYTDSYTDMPMLERVGNKAALG